VTVAAFFDAARELKRELGGGGLSQAEVDALNAVIASWGKVDALSPTALSDGPAFFGSVRAAFGSLEQPQVDGFGALLQACGVARWPLAFAAYGLATAWHETAKTMQPVREAFWLSEAWRKTNLRYYPWYGRGFVQLTWQKNYDRADEELELGGKLSADPDLALQPDIAARVMVHGMEGGWFTGKRLSDYLPLSGKAGFDAYTAARRIINGQDRAADIAKLAQQFEAALSAGGWA
jgi:putative chitinase